MASIVWSRRAASDVQRLHAFLRHKNPDAARRAVQAIREGVRVLALQPRMGRTIEDMPPEFREWPIAFGHSGYLVRYRLVGDGLVMLAVWHQREAMDDT